MKQTIVDRLYEDATYLSHLGGIEYARVVLNIREAAQKIEDLEQRILDDNKAYGCELRDPYGTIWQYTEEVRKENEALKATQAETDCTNWWPTVERFLQAAGTKPAYWGETVPEQIERAIAEINKKCSVPTVVHPCANGILPSPNAVYR